jgi:GMP synthase-like glutamine amidotransferase
MDVLSVVHGGDAGTELFGHVIAAAGHRHREWGFSSGGLPSGDYDAVLVFGGAVHPDQDDEHPWLKEQLRWLEGLIADGVPTLGICLGSQLLARAAGANVEPLPEPEIGWYEVALTDAGRADPVLSALPPTFTAAESHYYAHGLPDSAVELARNPACLQGFRLGNACWGVQFHPEVTEPQLNRWATDKRDVADPEAFLAETRRQISTWNELGRQLCNAFLAAAEQRAPRAA